VEGKTTTVWGEDTLLHVAQHALASLRDFGILEGATQKYLAPVMLPIEPFAFIAFDLLKRTDLEIVFYIHQSGDYLI